MMRRGGESGCHHMEVAHPDPGERWVKWPVTPSHLRTQLTNQATRSIYSLPHKAWSFWPIFFRPTKWAKDLSCSRCRDTHAFMRETHAGEEMSLGSPTNLHAKNVNKIKVVEPGAWRLEQPNFFLFRGALGIISNGPAQERPHSETHLLVARIMYRFF